MKVDMNKELELEAKKYVKDIHAMYQIVGMDCFTAGATSKYVEKQKLEFAIEQLKECHQNIFNTVENKIKELEQKLSDYE